MSLQLLCQKIEGGPIDARASAVFDLSIGRDEAADGFSHKGEDGPTCRGGLMKLLT